MKKPTMDVAGRKGAFCVLMATLVSLVMAFSSQAQVMLTDSGSVVQINPFTQAGMYDWSVGGINQLSQQWFWYRVGSSGPESSIDTISAPTVTQSTANQANVLYGNSTFSVDITYVLTGNTYSSGLNESIRIVNNTASPLDFHFFQYMDFDLGGQTANQSVVLNGTAARATQTLLSSMGLASETAIQNASHREANVFDATLLKLNDGTATTLNDVLTAGPGDVTFAFQWDYTIPAGGTRLISKIVTVPEPSAMVLLALGVVAFTLRRAGTEHRSAPVPRS